MVRRRQHRGKVPNEAIEVSIAGMSHEGRGIGHINGKVAFVDGALPGELVKARYQRNRSQFSELIAIEVMRPASTRTSPPCEYAQECGGCSLQHWQSSAQLEFKESMLIDQFSRIAGVKVEDYALLPKLQAKTLGYRRKARLAARYVSKKGGVLVGFREKGSGFVMDMNHCEILCDEVGVLIEPLRRLLSALDGREKIPQIEIAVGETAPKKASKKVVALVFRHLTELSADDFQALLDFGERERVEIYLQPGGAETVRKLFPPDRRARLYYYLPTYDLRMSFHPSDFTQINGELNSLVIDRAISMLDLNQSDSVLDLFCGLGNFTLPMARKAATVIGVEASIEMVGRARENALSNQVNNAEFCVDDLYKPLQGSLWLSKGYNKVLLDPPRSGAREIIPTLLALHPEKILYVSCNPATLARDTFDLMSGGYKLKSAGVMDMFPHTTHVESIAEFVPN